MKSFSHGEKCHLPTLISENAETKMMNAARVGVMEGIILVNKTSYYSMVEKNLHLRYLN